VLTGCDCSSEIHVLPAFIAASFSSIDLDELVKKSNRIHTLTFLKHAMDNMARTVESTVAAEEEWVAAINKLANLGKRFYAECTPGYYHEEGKENSSGFFSGQYSGGAPEFYKILNGWPDEGGLEGLEIQGII